LPPNYCKLDMIILAMRIRANAVKDVAWYPISIEFAKMYLIENKNGDATQQDYRNFVDQTIAKYVRNQSIVLYNPKTKKGDIYIATRDDPLVQQVYRNMFGDDYKFGGQFNSSHIIATANGFALLGLLSQTEFGIHVRNHFMHGNDANIDAQLRILAQEEIAPEKTAAIDLRAQEMREQLVAEVEQPLKCQIVSLEKQLIKERKDKNLLITEVRRQRGCIAELNGDINTYQDLRAQAEEEERKTAANLRVTLHRRVPKACLTKKYDEVLVVLELFVDFNHKPSEFRDAADFKIAYCQCRDRNRPFRDIIAKYPEASIALSLPDVPNAKQLKQQICETCKNAAVPVAEVADEYFTIKPGKTDTEFLDLVLHMYNQRFNLNIQ